MCQQILSRFLENLSEALLMNIVLIGCRAAGKTSVGRKLAPRLQMGFVDIDHLIEARCGTPIVDIVKSHGWDHFRKMEKGIIAEISTHDGLIIAPGGGAVLDAENIAMLRKNGLLIWLKADQEVLVGRINQDPRNSGQRPTLTGKGTLEELGEIMAHRDPLYEMAAEVQVDTSSLDMEIVVETLQSILQKRLGRG